MEEKMGTERVPSVPVALTLDNIYAIESLHIVMDKSRVESLRSVPVILIACIRPRWRWSESSLRVARGLQFLFGRVFDAANLIAP